jgi:type IV pilus assembly protein PilX
MNGLPRNRGSFAFRRGQRGVALVVALILLVVATMIGLAATRGTMLQERMSSNTFDRSLAFQRSEAALRAAEAAITADWRIVNLGGVDCSAAACPIVPANAFTATDAFWRDVPAAFDVNDALTPGVPQYHIAFVGTGTDDSSFGLENNAGSGYAEPPPADTLAYYRVTARSSDPADADGRSIVVLQATIRRPM